MNKYLFTFDWNKEETFSIFNGNTVDDAVKEFEESFTKFNDVVPSYNVREVGRIIVQYYKKPE